MIRITPLEEKHLEDAAALVVDGYQVLRQEQPLLPAKYEEPAVWLPMLRNIAAAGPGLAALDGGRLAGFLAGWLMPTFKGKRTAYSPEWANAAVSQRVYQEMYNHQAAAWVADGYRTHFVSVLPTDSAGLDAWFWFGFGLVAVDAVRGLEPIEGVLTEVTIHRALPPDLDRVIELSEALRQHVAGPPTYWFQAPRARHEHEARLLDPEWRFWLARRDGQVVAFICHGPANDDVCTLIYDEGTTSIYGAFTETHVRGEDVGTALLNQVLSHARSAGYRRCAVDFESANAWASRFWMRHFRPVCYSLVRYIDTVPT